MPQVRHKMRLDLATPMPAGLRWPYRAVVADDVPALGALMRAAYQGTIDDEGETPEEAVEEMRRTFGGAYGPFDAGASFVIEEGDRLLSATLVTRWQDAPLLAFAMTHPDAKGRGMATYLIRHSINALVARRVRELYLYVTEGNDYARHIYDALGFRVIESR